MARPFVLFALATALLAGPTGAAAQDPCAQIAGRAFVPPAEVLACQKSFAFNSTLHANVLSNVERVLDFYSYEGYYANAPEPFEESTNFIRPQLLRMRLTQYSTDYDFNRDLFDVTQHLNDGHTRWYPLCYGSHISLLPTPIISLSVNGSEDIYVAPNAGEFIDGIDPAFRNYYDGIGFNWRRLAGAKVTRIEGQDPWAYLDEVAKYDVGQYLDHGIRLNTLFSGYRILGNVLSQVFGILGGLTMRLERDALTLTLIPANSTAAETVKVPYLTQYMGSSFTDKASYWAKNCAAQPSTNGADINAPSTSRAVRKSLVEHVLEPIANVIPAEPQAFALPVGSAPTAPAVSGTSGVVRSYVLPGNTTGVIFVGSFSPSSQSAFREDIVRAVQQLQAAGVTKLLIDLTNNVGGFVALGVFMFNYLAGKAIGYPAFDTSIRANALSQKIVFELISKNISGMYYNPSRWAFVNDTQQAADYNFVTPSVSNFVNGMYMPTSQRFHDIYNFTIPIPNSPPFDPANIAIVSNGACVSTCALFATSMVERLGVKLATFGGPRGGKPMEYRAMAGNQVFDWPALDSEIKTAHVKDDERAPPDLLVNGNMRVNWRTAYSFKRKSDPIAWISDPAQNRFPYTPETWINPQNLWTFAASKLLS